MSKVFLGVGHGGADPGAVANGYKEKVLNLNIALSCMQELNKHGVTVQMSRTTDEDDSLNEEIKECNAFKPDIAVDIHNNAGGGDGVETFYSYTGEGKELADYIISEIVKLGQNSRGSKIRKNERGSDYYGFIRLTKCEAVIVEPAFVDNVKDMEILDTLDEQKAVGVAIAKAILKRLGITYKESAQSTQETKLYRVQVGAYKVKANAEAMLEKLKKAGFEGFIKYE